MDYSTGRYNVFEPSGIQIGRIDQDEFVRSGSQILYRIDGNEVYGVKAGHPPLAFIENERATTREGTVLFWVEEE